LERLDLRALHDGAAVALHAAAEVLDLPGGEGLRLGDGGGAEGGRAATEGQGRQPNGGGQGKGDGTHDGLPGSENGVPDAKACGLTARRERTAGGVSGRHGSRAWGPLRKRDGSRVSETGVTSDRWGGPGASRRWERIRPHAASGSSGPAEATRSNGAILTSY